MTSSSPSSSSSRTDADYFKSYSWLDIHDDMLHDTTRTLAYRDAIFANRALFADKVVLDVGCGTGILSLFAADAGAKTVYAVDASDMADYARMIVACNGKAGVIEVIKGKMEEVVLPQQVDVIISEWMGYFLLYESMLDSVIYARDRWLRRPTGVMFPTNAAIYLMPFTNEEYMNERVGFWHDVYGYDMSDLMPLVRRRDVDEVITEQLTDEHMIALTHTCIKRIDIMTVTALDIDAWSSSFTFQCIGRVPAHGFAAWFDVEFIPSSSSSSSSSSHQHQRRRVSHVLSTSPSAEPTHWAQALFFFEHPVNVSQDDRISGTIHAKKHADNHRLLDVSFAWTIASNHHHQHPSPPPASASASTTMATTYKRDFFMR